MCLPPVFDAAVWGTVGQWFAAIATVLLGGLTLYFSRSGERRAREVEREQEIRSVAFVLRERWEDPSGPSGELIAINSGSAAFTKVSIDFPYQDPATGEESTQYVERAIFGPGTDIRVELGTFAMVEQDVFRMTLTDVQNRVWRRSTDGTFSEIVREGSTT